MSKLALRGSNTGTATFTLEAPATNTDRTLLLPDNAGTVLTSASNLAGVTGVGKVLQVVQGTKEGLESTTSTSFVASSLSASITPSSESSKILVMYNIRHSVGATDEFTYSTIYRNSTELSGENNGFVQVGATGARLFVTSGASYLDAPSSTSEITYAIYFKAGGAAQIGYLGAVSQLSTITLVEVAA